MRPRNSSRKSSDPAQKDFLGVLFRCCNVYGRIYEKRKTIYTGRCPSCGRLARVKTDGESDRQFYQAFPVD